MSVKVTNRFKGLDLIDRVPEELWTKVCDIVKEAVIKTIPKKRKHKKMWDCVPGKCRNIFRMTLESFVSLFCF